MKNIPAIAPIMTNTPGRARRALTQRGPAPLALEPRVMFDGATGDAVLAARMEAELAPIEAAHPVVERTESLVPAAVGAPDAQASRHEVVFIEDNLPNYLQLAAAVKDGTQVIVLDHTRDGLQQMIDALKGQGAVDAIHLVTHGATAQIELGSTTVSADNIDSFGARLAELGKSMTADADLLIYGCDVAQGEVGSGFVARMAELTGADVAASTDITGSKAFDGNWTLEAHKGDVQTEAMALDRAGWDGELVVTVYDASWRSLVFENRTAMIGTDGTKNGDVMRFNSVITIGGQTIDAVVTTVLDRATLTTYDGTAAVPNQSGFFQPSMTESAAGGNAVFKIDFYVGGTFTGVGTGVKATLQNVAVNSYDIDSSGGNDRQFQSFKGFSRYELSKSTTLQVVTNPNGSVTFQATSNFNNPTTTPYADGYRVRVYYDTMSSFQVAAGVANATGTANFAFDFSVGPNWTGDTTVTTTTAPIISYSGVTFAEAVANDGSIAANATITLANGTFSGADGAELSGISFASLPAGLIAHVTRTSSTTAILSFTGNALNHENANDVRNFGVTFGNAAFTSGNADAVTGASRADLVLDFADAGDHAAPVVAAGQVFGYAENRSAGTVVGTIAAADAVGVTGFQFALTGTATSADGFFAIDNSGAISLTAAGAQAGRNTNDFEIGPNFFNYTVQARDAAGNWSAAENVVLNVTNIDDRAPDFVSGPSATADEHQALLYTAQASDDVDYTNHVVTYGLAVGSEDADLLRIDAATGAVSLASGTLDAETKSTYSFTVIATDASGNARTQAVTVGVTHLGQADVIAPVISGPGGPGAPDGNVNIAEGTTAAASLHADEGVTWSIVGGADGDLFQIDAAGNLVFKSAPDYETPQDGAGANSYLVQVQATDAAGNSSLLNLTVNVLNENELPIASDAAISIRQDATAAGQLPAATDADGDQVKYALGEAPQHGTASVGEDGSYTYAPAAGYSGNDSFTFTVSDGAGGSSTYTVVVVIAADSAPVAADAAIATNEDTPVSGQLPAASDVDGDSLHYALGQSAANGSVTIGADGSYIYTPNTDFNGADSFTYTVSDGHGGNNTYTVEVTVGAVNDAPTAADAVIATAEDTPVAGQLPAASDVDGDSLHYALDQSAANGSVTIGDDGGYTYTPGADFNGSDSFTYTVSDDNGGNNTYTVEVTVGTVNDAPAAADAAIETAEDTPVSGQLPAASDVDGDSLHYALDQSAANGSVTIGDDGSYTYTPNTDFNGSDRFTYTVRDDNGGNNTYTVEVTVGAVNDAPAAADAAITAGEDKPVSGQLPAASDVDGDALHYALGQAPANGSVTIGDDGSYTYTPNTDFNGSDSFTYTVSDGHRGSNTYKVEVSVEAVNDAPVAQVGAETAATVGEAMAPVSVPAFIDADGGTIVYSAALADGSELPGWLSFDPITRTFSGTPPAGSAGSWDIRVSGSDGSLSDSATVTITVGLPPPPAQSITIGSMTKDTGASASDFVTADGSAGRIVSGSIGAALGHNEVVQVSFDGGASWTDAATSGTSWSVVDTGTHGQDWTIIARVANTAADLTGGAAWQAVTLDATQPDAPTGDSIATGSTTPVLTGTAVTAPGEELQVTVNGSTYIVIPHDGEWTLDLATAMAIGAANPLEAGQTYDVTATIIDLAGNARSSTGLVTVGAPVAPHIPDQPAPSAVTPVPVTAQQAPAAPAPAPAPDAFGPGAGNQSAWNLSLGNPSAWNPGATVVTDAVLNSAGDTSMQRLSAGQGTRGADETFEDTLRHRAELSDVYTQSMGFRTVVAKADEPALLLFQGVPDQFVEAESQVSLIVPADAFAHTQAKETIRLAAMLQDGRPLPSWIQFDGQSGKFTGEVPKGLAGELRVKVIARDTAGREAAALFRVNLGASRTAAGEPRAPAGRPGLSQQLRDTRSASAKAAPAQAQHK